MTRHDSRATGRTLLLTTAATVLVVAACSGTEDPLVTTTSVSPVIASTSEGAEPQERRRSGRPGPEEFAKRFDQNGDGQVQLSELPPRARQRIGQADSNGDGVLSQDEIAQGMSKRRAERFARADHDGDGKLTESEVGSSWWSRMRAADADSDGAVTRAELDQAHAQGKLGPHGSRGRHGKGMRGRGCPAGRMFDHMDANGDGRLEPTEVPARMWAHLEAADADGDGAVSRAEADQAREQGKLGPRSRSGWKGQDGPRGEPAGQ
ncbi:hypothetical protein ACFL5O_04865 [Myxococcota bacterium]